VSISCSHPAEVICKCTTPVSLYCNAHGYDHYKLYEHDMEDINSVSKSLQYLDADNFLLTGEPVKRIQAIEGPSLFRKAILKYLKKLPKDKIKKMGISDDLFSLLFETNYKVQCFVCDKGVSCIKLHLFKVHKYNKNSRKEYWEENVDYYTDMRLVFTDVV
jgi:hypothetical protein